MKFAAPPLRSALGVLLALVVLLPQLSCGRTSRWVVTSRDEARVLQPRVLTSVYRMIDPNTADIFVSDLPEGQLLDRLSRAAAGEQGLPATVAHVHLFLVPRAGRTPIEFTASNTSVTQLVMTESSAGVYGGGAFMLLSSSVGDEVLRGKIRGGTVRLTRSGEGFVDQLGPSIVSGTIAARRDDQLAEAISVQLLRALSAQSAPGE